MTASAVLLKLFQKLHKVVGAADQVQNLWVFAASHENLSLFQFAFFWFWFCPKMVLFPRQNFSSLLFLSGRLLLPCIRTQRTPAASPPGRPGPPPSRTRPPSVPAPCPDWSHRPGAVLPPGLGARSASLTQHKEINQREMSCI